jgi:3-deoxy-D-manno-octulosonic-acid transferase
MWRVYSLLAYCAVVPVLAYLWWRGRKDPGYRLRWRERLGLQGMAPAQQGGVVLHCASVGEVIAARPLIEQLLAEPGWSPLVLTCSTPTGSRMIARQYGDRVVHRYFPLDLPGATRRFLRSARPRLVLLLERELWPNFLYQAQQQDIPVVLVNARLSLHSAAGYARWRGLMGPALASLHLVCAEDNATAGRFRSLGVSAERLQITGNIKSDIRVDPALRAKIGAVRLTLAQRPVLTAGSTHAGEDEALIDAFKAHLKTSPDTLLILVPRHPERFAPVAHLLVRSGLRFARHSLGQEPSAETQVLLGDTLGELMLWYGVSDACFVGGSLITRGGHNPLEVLCLDKPLLAGPHTANFEFMYSALQNTEGVLLVADASAVFAQFERLWRDHAAARALAAHGFAFYQRMAGATARTMTLLRERVPALSTALRTAAPAVVRQGRDVVWFDTQCFVTGGSQLFDPDWWRSQGATASAGAGRGKVHWVANAQGSYLLRHYYRGGLMAKISRDLFLARPEDRTRAMREYSLLTQLRSRGLPVPHACAARMSRCGPWYRADILVKRIPGASDVADILHSQRAIAPGEWQTLGRAVRQLHDHQVYHADLNCHNLMLDTEGRAWIVDFDKCEFREGAPWKQENLDRLLRSLRKELRLDPAFRWHDSDWQAFLAGYAQTHPDPAALEPTNRS